MRHGEQGVNTGRRLVEQGAAWAALALLAAAVALLAIGVARSVLASLLALLGVLIAVTAGWYAVSRRGAERWLAAAVMAGGVGLLVYGIVAANLRPLRMVLTLVFAALSVACARVALHRTRRAWRQALRALPAAARPAHPVLIMNPKSGGGKAERFRLAEECAARGIEPVLLRPGDDLLQLARDAIARGADVIGMAGGDGSQALVASVAAEHRIPHVVVPAGTRNHFALDLGLDRDDVVGALSAFTDGVERRIDLADVNGRIFVNNASLGLYAKIVQTPQYRDAKLKTAADLLPGMLGPDAKPFDLRFSGPDGTRYATAHLILVSNNRYQIDQLAGRGTREHLDRGVLGVVSSRIDGPAEARRFVALEAVGQVRRFPGWLEWETGRFEVESDCPVEIGIDGESLTMAPPLVFSSRPGALAVRVPRTAPGASPASTAVHITSRSTIGALLAVAVGRLADPGGPSRSGG
jgi:diacylglycerol kinase family enzyme